MSGWSTRARALAALRTQIQDDGGTQRYSDAELGAGLDEALAELNQTRPILQTLSAAVGSDRVVRLDSGIVVGTFGGVVSVINTMVEPHTPIYGWYYFEAGGQHKILLPPDVAIGTVVDVHVRAGYGFAFMATINGSHVSIDTNIPVEWREKVIEGAQGYVLELYGAREVGRTNVAPAMMQQTARAAAVKLRDFRQWLAALPFADAGRQVVTWGLAAVDARTSDHRGFD